MVVNIDSNNNATNIKTASDGVWQGDSPLNFAFPLLIVQIAVVLFTSRLLAFLLRPLRQPKVIAEILGGILLGPSALGRNKEFIKLVFPPWSTPILESVASIGLLFFLFLVGLELDLTSLRRSGRKSFIIAVAGISLPFVFGAAISLLLRKAGQNPPRHHEIAGYGQFVVFIGVALSITAFPVLARILAELKLLTTHVGQTAMAAAAFNDVAAWILLALAVALPGNNGDGDNHSHHHTASPFISVWVLFSGLGFVIFMMFIVRPAMKWMERMSSSEHDGAIHEGFICVALAGVMISGFITDLIGLHSIFGAFVFGLTIPKGRWFSERLIDRIEDFVSVLLLPLYFASSGLKTDVAKIRGAEAWGLLALVISMACAGKILGTFLTAMMCMIPARESLTLGVLMNTKGLVELVVLNIGREKKVLNDEIFAILVLMALFTTFITTPSVVAIYRPFNPRIPAAPQSPKGQNCLSNTQQKDEMRILACVHGARDVPSLIKLIETLGSTMISASSSSSSSSPSSLKVYVMHLIEFTDRPSSIVMIQRVRSNGLPLINRFYKGSSSSSSSATRDDQIVNAFGVYGQINNGTQSLVESHRVKIRHLTGVSSLSTMHEDICHMAEDKRVSMIVLPFHNKDWSCNEDQGDHHERRAERFTTTMAAGWGGVNQRVMENAKCSVAIFVDRGFGRRWNYDMKEGEGSKGGHGGERRVGVVFVGGSDDREALTIGSRMAQHPMTKLTLLHLQNKFRGNSFIRSSHVDKAMDEEAVEDIKKQSEGLMECKEIIVDGDVKDIIETLGKSREYELLVIGKRHRPLAPIRSDSPMAEEEDEEEEDKECIGDILASLDRGIQVSVLVIQGSGKLKKMVNV